MDTEPQRAWAIGRGPRAGMRGQGDAWSGRRAMPGMSPGPGPAAAPAISMTTRAWEELDGGLGSCQALEDHSALAETQEDRAPATTPRLADSGSPPHDSQEPVAEGRSMDTRPKKMEKEPAARGTPGTGKERLKAGASPRSAPARKKAQTAPPPQPPPPPPALSEELPWGDLSLNKCLVLASLVALLGSAFRLCRDAVAGEAALQARAPEPWVPPSSAPREPSSPLPKFEAQAPPSAPPAPRAEAEVRPKIPGSREAAEKDEEEPGEATREAVGEDRVPLADRGPKERPRREGKPRKEKPRKEERPKKERRRKEEKPRAAREPREALPRRWESREGGHRPWARDSRDAEPRKRQAWVSPRRSDEEQRPGSRQKLRAGKGRD
ncbi:junctional sarcoplasmic reticulum protein 1 [Symphalangus syndactylus]|uniref:junctional sarcoplasmic reticulum protein 1 n=1 Tax=Symphalangus syndactylus TaxID=9590 RepID=UPI003003CABA